MSTSELIVQLVRAFVWPATVLMLALLFRHELRGLSHRIGELRYRGIAVRFEQDVAALSEKIGGHELKLEKLRVDQGRPSSALLEKAWEFVDVSPGSAVLVAWSAIENSLWSAVPGRALSADPPSEVSAIRFARILRERGEIESSNLAAIEELRRLRNAAAHSLEDIRPSSAQQYVSVATDLAMKLDRLSETQA